MRPIRVLFILLLCSCNNLDTVEEVEKIEDGIRKVGQFKNGILHGTLIKYDSLGRLISRSNYVNGVIEGKHSEYYLNGNLMYEVTFEKGLKDGILKHYQENGDLWEYFYYEKDTTRYIKTYDESGQIVKYFLGTEVELTIIGDSLKLEASLLHSNIKDPETGIILYGDSKNNVLYHEKGDTSRAELMVSKELFNKYSTLFIEVCELENGNISSRCQVPIAFSNSRNTYFSEWTGKGYVEVVKNFN